MRSFLIGGILWIDAYSLSVFVCDSTGWDNYDSERCFQSLC